MKFVIISLFALSAGLGIFAYWGSCTEAGRRQYDEMDGMYPGFAGLLSMFLFAISIFLLARHLDQNKQ